MLELAILGLLKEQAMHGYELKKQLTAKLGSFWRVSYGSLYPTLKRLEKRGAIDSVWAQTDSTRRRNVYRITEAGEREFLELIEDPAASAWEEDKFPLRVAFFRYVPPQVRLRLLERRKEYLNEKLADLKSSLDEASDRIDTYTLSLLKHGLEATAADIAWLDDLIATERRQLAENPTPDDQNQTSTDRARERGTSPA